MSPRALGSGLSKGQGSRFVLKLEDQNPLSISSFLFSQGQSCPCWLFQWLLPANPHSCPWSWAGSGATGEGRAMVSLAVHCCPSSSFLAIPPLVTSKRAGTHVLLSSTSQPAGAGCGGESLRHRLGCLSNWFGGGLGVPLRGARVTRPVTCVAGAGARVTLSSPSPVLGSTSCLVPLTNSSVTERGPWAARRRRRERIKEGERKSNQYII